MSNQKGAKIMAILALIGIIVSIIGTGILFMVERNAQEKEYKRQLEEYIKNNSGTIELSTGKIEINSGKISTGNVTN